MNFNAAGIMLLLAFFAGIASFLLIPRFEEPITESGCEQQTDAPAFPAAGFADLFAKENRKRLGFTGLMAVLCAAAAWLACRAGTDVINLCRQMCVALMLLSAMIIDKKTHKIPNFLPFAALAEGTVLLAAEAVFYDQTVRNTLIQSLTGLVCCVVLFYVLSRLTKDGMGMGDVKLIASMGWMLGFGSAIMAVLLSLILCTLASVFLLFEKKKNKNDRIPFGPFMFFGYILMLLLFNL